MGWQISANLGRHVRPGADARGWRWQLTRGAEVAQVVVEITGKAWASDPLSLPDDTRHALETDGRTELLKVLDQDRHPASSDAALPAAHICLPAKPVSGLTERDTQASTPGRVRLRPVLVAATGGRSVSSSPPWIVTGG